MLRASALTMILCCQPAFAMNWEGHDGYMTGFPPGEALLEAIPEARPPPPRDCPVTPEMVAKNPYEQIPLPQHNCPPSEKQPKSKH